jgi:hypothetical protein
MKYIFLFILVSFNLLIANIGQITNLKGEVFILRSNLNHIGTKGFILETSDIIATGSNAKVQFKLQDDTVISIGKSSIFEIEKYFFHKVKKSKNIANFKAKTGIFRVMTGKIGKLNREKFVLKTKNATIGIRGTQFSGIIKDNFEEIHCIQGEIIINSFGQSLNLIAGQMIDIQKGKIPKVPRKMPKNYRHHVKKQLDKAKFGRPNEPFIFAINDTQKNFTDFDKNNFDELNEEMNIKDDDKFDVIYPSKVDLYKIDVQQDEDFEWGYWAYREFDKELGREIEVIESAWVEPKAKETPFEVIDNFIKQKITASYTGEAFGLIEDLNTRQISKTNNGSFNLDFDFGNKTINGNLNLTYDKNSEINININKNSDNFGDISSNGFFVESDSLSSNNGEIQGNLNGKFYGDEAENIAGNFDLQTDNGQKIVGAIKGSK